jgi:hypothetical protein
MVRINLIRGERRKERRVKRAAIAPTETTKQLGFVAIFVLTIAVGAWLWFDVQGKKSDLQQQIRVASQERERLKSIKELVDRLEVERERLAERLDVLANLKNNLRTPLYSLFFIYLAQQNNPGVVISEMRERPGEVEGLDKYVLKGESSDENLNKFIESLARETLVSTVDIVSVSNGRFEIAVVFHPIAALAAEDDELVGDESASGG